MWNTMETTPKASIGLKVKMGLERSPQGDDRTYLFKEVIITPFWAAGQRCITKVGDDSEVRRQSAMAADSRALVPSHIDREVHRSVACGTSRSREFKKKFTERVHTSSSQPIVIEPKHKPTTLLSTTGASSLEISWQSTGSWPPSCDSTNRDSRFSMEGCELESICKAAVPWSSSRLSNPSTCMDPNGCSALKTQVTDLKWCRRWCAKIINSKTHENFSFRKWRTLQHIRSSRTWRQPKLQHSLEFQQH